MTSTPSIPASAASPASRVEAVAEQRVHVAEEEERHVGARADPARRLEHAGQAHAALQRAVAGALDDGAVGQRVRERHPELEDVRPRVRDLARDVDGALQRRIAGGHEGDQGLASRPPAATRSGRRSGSFRRRPGPCPCRRARTGSRARAGRRSDAAFAATQATAWADSRAGMIPSVAASSAEARPAPPSSLAVRVAHAAAVAQQRVLGADRRIVEPGRDRVRGQHVPGLVLQQVGPRAVQDAHRRPLAERSARRGRPRAAAAPARLHADHLHRVVEEGVEEADARSSPRPRRRRARRAGRPRAPGSAPAPRAPITDWKSRTIVGYGCAPSTEPSR